MSRHLGGTAAIIAGCLWLVGLAMGNLPGSDIALMFPDVMIFAGMGMLLPALAGLNSFQSRRNPLHSWVAFGIPALGVVSYCLGSILAVLVGEQPLYYDLVPPLLVFGYGATVAGSGVFAVVNFRTGEIPRPGAALLGLSAAMMVAAVALFALPLQGVWKVAEVVGAIGYVAFPIGWITLGWSAVQVDRGGAIERTPRREDRTSSLHAGGAAAVLGGALWLAGLVVHERSDSYSVFLIIAGMGALIVALAGLTSFRFAIHPIVSSVVFIIPAFGMALSSATSLYSQWLWVQPLDSWVSASSVLGSVALYGGTALFAVLTYRAGMLSQRAPWMLVVGSGLVLGGLAYYEFAEEGAFGMNALYRIGFLLVACGWIALGWSAIRLHRTPATTAAPAAA